LVGLTKVAIAHGVGVSVGGLGNGEFGDRSALVSSKLAKSKILMNKMQTKTIVSRYLIFLPFLSETQPGTGQRSNRPELTI